MRYGYPYTPYLWAMPLPSPPLPPTPPPQPYGDWFVPEVWLP